MEKKYDIQDLATVLGQIDDKLSRLRGGEHELPDARGGERRNLDESCMKREGIHDEHCKISPYGSQRRRISRIFGSPRCFDRPNYVHSPYCCCQYDVDMILVRLRLIDTIYSTNGNLCYLSVEELAEAIYRRLGSSEVGAANVFYNFVLNPTESDPVAELFGKKYGIRKNLHSGVGKVSLLSKYAFFQLEKFGPQKYPLGFPICDAIALNMYPEVYMRLNVHASQAATDNNSGYINAFKSLLVDIKRLTGYVFKNQEFDVLDQYLWRIGKMRRGSYTLLLDRQDYEQLITNIGMNDVSSKTFDDDDVEKRCKQQGMNAIAGIKDSVFRALYQHWLTYF